jgi:plasmid stabilization system protein ParE
VTAATFGPRARADFRQALAWIARDNETAAEALLQATLQGARRIGARPLLGRHRPDLLPVLARERLPLPAGLRRGTTATGRPAHAPHGADLAPLLAQLTDLAAERPDQPLSPRLSSRRAFW